MNSWIAANKHIDSWFASARNMDDWFAETKKKNRNFANMDHLFACLFVIIDGLREGRDDNKWTQNGRDMCIYRFRV